MAGKKKAGGGKPPYPTPLKSKRVGGMKRKGVRALPDRKK